MFLKEGKMEKKSRSFLEGLIGVKNDGNYKVFSFLFLKIKFKNKHKILSDQLSQTQDQIVALNTKLVFIGEVLKSQIIAQDKTTEELKSNNDSLAQSFARQNDEVKKSLQNLSDTLVSVKNTAENSYKKIEDLQSLIRDLWQLKDSMRNINEIVSQLKIITESSCKKVEDVALKYDEGFKKSADIIQNIDRQVCGSANAQKFQSMISGSKWLKYQNFTLSGLAMDNAGLFSVFRILNDMKPRNVLEFGLGQSSKLVHQYCAFDKIAKAVTVEHNKEWIKSFINEIDGYSLNINVHKLYKPNINGIEALSYEGLENLYGQKFDFILVDGPSCQERYSRPQVLDFARAGMPDRFCILIDDTEREGEKETLNLLLETFKEQGREVLTKTYTGEKSQHTVICSPDLKFLVSII